MNDKYCVACKHYFESTSSSLSSVMPRYRCGLAEERHAYNDIVTGKRIIPFRSCYDMRSDSTYCGPFGAWFVEKKK